MRNTAHKSLPTQKNTKLYGRHRMPYNLVFIWCFNLQNGLFRKVKIHIFESHKTLQYRTFLGFTLPYGGAELLLDKEDIYTIIGLLNNDPEVAFIIRNGSNKRSKWIAVDRIDNYNIERYCIWHIPSGPLPLLSKGTNNYDSIVNQYGGWEEKWTGSDKSNPYFGTGHPGVIWLNNRTNDLNRIGLSSFEWIGNNYKEIGNPAHQSTEIWWKNLRKK